MRRRMLISYFRKTQKIYIIKDGVDAVNAPVLFNMKYIHKVAFLLLVIGGLNWLAFALIGWEVGQLFGGMDALVSKVIYILVGLSALYELITHWGRCKECSSSM